MKNTFYFSLVFILSFKCIPSFAQESEKVMYNFPAIGDTLDKDERDFYILFPNVKDFEYAVFYIRENEAIDATVYSLVKGKLEHHTYENYFGRLQNLNHYLEQVDRVSASTPGGQEIIVYKTDGSEIKGELISVKQNIIILFPTNGGINLIDDSDLITRLKVHDITKIEIANNRNVLSNCLLSYVTGSLGGGLLGAGITAIFTDEEWYWVGMAIGAIVGWIVTYIIFSSDYYNYEVDNGFDLITIKEYARFKNFEPKYIRQIE